ncbi:MAG TPA: homocysteine S-methyltransferase family protein [Thermoanaerobaculia bacterium]|jgi:S-methylmethionine-dependent homocysteine/selenocysteine methylase
MGNLSARFRERLKAGPPLVLDSAMGTELQRRDADTTLPLWSARALVQDPELVWTIHGDEAGSGAEILTANTFRTHARTLAKAQMGERAAELTALAIRLAHQAASLRGREIFVAGSLSPLEDCYRPDLAPEGEALGREHREQARFLADAGVDLILAETHNSIREAVAAAEGAKATGLPFVVSLVTDGKGRLLSGEPIAEAAARLLPLAPDALGINCVPAAGLSVDLGVLAASAPGVPLAAYGNLGLPADGPGWSFTESLDPAAYAEAARGWIERGARIVGGCCGTTSRYTRALVALIAGLAEEKAASSA